MFQFRLMTVVLIAFGMAASTATAQLLPERLVPPQQFFIPTLPTTEQPVVRHPAGADRVPAHLWSLPIGAFPGMPTALTSERLPVDWRRPAIDVPTLASESDPVRPASPRQTVAGNAYLLAADPLKAHGLDRFPLLGEPSVRAADDPTMMSTHLHLTVAVPLAVPNTAQFLRLGVVDPFEHLRAIRLTVPQADSDAPTVAREIPPRPQFAPIAASK